MSSELWLAYKLRWKRRRLLYRSFRSRRQLTEVSNKTALIKPGAILCFSCVRNEALRLPYFLDHCRRQGVDHFFFVSNSSDDETDQFLESQPDVSLWQTKASYKSARYGVDWLTWLQRKYAHGHWALTLDADELLTYANWEKDNLHYFTKELDLLGAKSFGAFMLDVYPKGPVSKTKYIAGTDPLLRHKFFDVEKYTQTYEPKYKQTIIRGGARERMFFKEDRNLSPVLQKVPLVKWDRSYAYVTSTHMMLPRSLNLVRDSESQLPTGILLHTKFLNIVLDKSREDQTRQEHFMYPELFEKYYEKILSDPDFWHPNSVEFTGWEQLVDLNLMQKGRKK